MVIERIPPERELNEIVSIYVLVRNLCNEIEDDKAFEECANAIVAMVRSSNEIDVVNVFARNDNELKFATIIRIDMLRATEVDIHRVGNMKAKHS